MTTEQLAANRKSASNVIRMRLGLSSIAPSDWTYDQRVQYDQALAAYISSLPAAFSEQDLITAQEVAGNNYGGLQDSSFQFSDFLEETAANAAEPFQAIGDGIISTAKAAKWAIPVIAGVAVILLIIAYNKKVNA